MTIDSDWFPGSEPEQLVTVQNIEDKINVYQAELDLTPDELAQIHILLLTFIEVVTKSEQIQATAKMVTIYKNQIKDGEPKGAPAPNPPTFLTIKPPPGASIGVVEQIRLWRNKWLLANGYTPEIGADLMIIGTSHADTPDGDLEAALKYTVVGSYTTDFKFSLRDKDAMNVQWRFAGVEVWNEGKFFTGTSGSLIITPPVAGQPVTIEVRARLMEKNQFVGAWSPIYTIYVTP